MSHQELEIEQEEELLLRHLTSSMSMEAAELVSNVTESAIEATDGSIIAGHSAGAKSGKAISKSSKVSNGTIQLCI